MMSRREAILASFGVLASSQISLAECESNQILYVMRFPVGSCVVDSEEISNSEIARILVENMQPGSRVCLPGDRDHKGQYEWNLKVFDLRRGKTEEIHDSLKQVPVKRRG